MAMTRDLETRRYNYFKSFMFDGSVWCGEFAFPKIKKSFAVPCNPISFVESRSVYRRDDRWLHFFAEDLNFECVWTNPKAYLSMFKNFAGVMTPDFSMYADLPKAHQIWNCYRNRVLAYWMQSNDVNIVPSVNWTADPKGWNWCFDGLPRGGTVAVSGNGCYLNPFCRQYFINGFNEMCTRLSPDVIVAVGYIPKELRKRSNVIVLQGYSQQRHVRERA